MASAQLRPLEQELVRKFLDGLPRLAIKDTPQDESCPICLTPFMTILEEEAEHGASLKAPSELQPQYGVIKLEGCGHIFCARDISEWIETRHGSCPTCRRVFLDIAPESEYESSDGGEYVPAEGDEDDETDDALETDGHPSSDIDADDLAPEDWDADVLGTSVDAAANHLLAGFWTGNAGYAYYESVGLASEDGGHYADVSDAGLESSPAFDRPDDVDGYSSDVNTQAGSSAIVFEGEWESREWLPAPIFDPATTILDADLPPSDDDDDASYVDDPMSDSEGSCGDLTDGADTLSSEGDSSARMFDDELGEYGGDVSMVFRDEDHDGDIEDAELCHPDYAI